MEKITNWTQYKENPSDWIVKDWDKVLIPELNYNLLKHAYRQYPVSKNSCSIHWIMSTISNTFNITFSLAEREEIRKEAKKLWANDEWWWRFADAIKLLKNWCEENKDLKFRYYKVQKEEFEDYAKQWFAIYWGIRIKEWSTRDKLKDWYVWDDVEHFWETKFGHAVCFTMIWDEFGFVDNYPNKTKYNEVKFRNLDWLLETWYLMNVWYILMTNDVDEITEALKNRPEAIAKRKELNNK